MNQNTQPSMPTSYRPQDVTLLLKDITGKLEPLPTRAREARIQSGVDRKSVV